MSTDTLQASFSVLLACRIGVPSRATPARSRARSRTAQTGEALVGANVVIEGTTDGAATNIDGYYVILNIPPGKYTLVASAVGYNKKTITNVSVSIDLTTTIDIPMQSAGRRNGRGGGRDRGAAAGHEGPDGQDRGRGRRSRSPPCP